MAFCLSHLAGLLSNIEGRILEFTARARDKRPHREAGEAITDGDEATVEWWSAAAMASAASTLPETRDASGDILADGDAVMLIKDLKVKGTSHIPKQGTAIRSIRLTADPEGIDCRHDSIEGPVPRTGFVRKR